MEIPFAILNIGLKQFLSFRFVGRNPGSLFAADFLKAHGLEPGRA